jgi:hypothetical protein
MVGQSIMSKPQQELRTGCGLSMENKILIKSQLLQDKRNKTKSGYKDSIFSCKN